MSAVLPHDWFPRALPANVVIGERSWLYSSFAFLHYASKRPCGVRIGNDTGVYDGSFFELGPRGEVAIGNFCTLVGAIIACNSRVVVEDYSFVAHEVVLADHDVAVPPGPGVAGDLPTSIVLGENCWIGARAVLLAGARIGAGAIVGAGAVVDCEVPAEAIFAGSPARQVGWARRRPRGAAAT